VFTFIKLDGAKAIDRLLNECGKRIRAVVIDGGLIGVSVAEALAKRGLNITVVEMKDRILNTILDEEASTLEEKALREAGVEIITGHTGAAYSFCILGWTVVHNGEISFYGINRRYLRQFGYHYTMQTDTEVVAYLFDLLIRKHNLPLEIVAKVLAPPFCSDIESMQLGEQKLVQAVRQAYCSLLLNGPFIVIVAHHGEMIGLTDRIRLRLLTVGEKSDMLYLLPEESAIRLICPELDRAWVPMGGEPIVGRLKTISQPQPAATREKVTAVEVM
jgi:glutamine phosphoribosylpyrophosphate amidotransferase